MIRNKLCFYYLLFTIFFPLSLKADFGDADFPIGMFDDGPKSYHDAWCRSIKNKCRVRFQGPAMWVEGQGGIQINQLISYRYDVDPKEAGLFTGLSVGEYYNYVSYNSSAGNQREALFIFSNREAQRDFIKAFVRWKKQESKPIPNFTLPNSQGPQDTHGRDKGLNPYQNPPIKDWSIKTNEKGMKSNINCDSPVWKNKPRCN